MCVCTNKVLTAPSHHVTELHSLETNVFKYEPYTTLSISIALEMVVYKPVRAHAWEANRTRWRVTIAWEANRKRWRLIIAWEAKRMRWRVTVVWEANQTHWRVIIAWEANWTRERVIIAWEANRTH